MVSGIMCNFLYNNKDCYRLINIDWYAFRHVNLKN